MTLSGISKSVLMTLGTFSPLKSMEKNDQEKTSNQNIILSQDHLNQLGWAWLGWAGAGLGWTIGRSCNKGWGEGA